MQSTSLEPPDAPVPSSVSDTMITTSDVRALFHELVPAWEDSLQMVVERQGKQISLPVLVTAQAFGYDPANPHPTVTPVPGALSSTEFYLQNRQAWSLAATIVLRRRYGGALPFPCILI